MNLLSVEGVSKSYGERTIFEPLSFGVSIGQKIAFIAKNGSGKTTLLKNHCPAGQSSDHGRGEFQERDPYFVPSSRTFKLGS